MQIEADLLKRTVSGGTRTKVIALGIGNRVSELELNDIASAPQDQNVILVQDYSSLGDVEEQLRNTSCTGEYRNTGESKGAFAHPGLER